MEKKSRQRLVVALLVIVLLIADQAIKIAVKTGMPLHSSLRITSWFYLFFTENNGMAFGMELTPKLVLTLFRLVAVAWGSWYIWRLIARGVSWGFLVCLTFVLAGAAGNIIDCLFYGLVFDAPEWGVAHFVPWGEGYGSLLHGRVVDMFYFPLVEWDWPAWLPFVGGQHFIFFSPIFNFADACISCGIIAILLFYRKALSACLNTQPSSH